MAVISKKDLSTKISERNGVSIKTAEIVVNGIVEIVSEGLAEGNEINLIGFGKFYVGDVAARKGRNPKTGEVINIEARKSPKFKAGKLLKDLCNK